MTRDFSGKAAPVTGAASGIGLAAGWILAVLLLALTESAIGQEKSKMKIRVTIDGTAIEATLSDTSTTRDFISLLPLELSLRDYHATEKVADLPRKLDTTSAPASYTPQAGDITYYAPWGNLAIFYKPFRTSSGLVRLGAFDGPIDALLKDGTFTVRIEAAD